jgi:glutamate-1-semialdehyde 2,1-aminomutase
VTQLHHLTESERAFARISRTIAGGESSYARLRAGQELVIEAAEGVRLRDADGNEYLDYCGGYGVNLFGNAPAFVVDAVRETIDRLGVHFAHPHRLYGEVGELVVSLVPGVEQLRFANSGTEATQAAVRLIRAATGREVVLRFEGHYHGWADHVSPGSPGVPGSVADTLWDVPWNDLGALDAAIERAGDGLAGSICELVPGSGGLVLPEPGYLAALCERVRAAGGLVIFDEVMTGFRLAPGGAQELYGVTPDVTTLGKVIGGGLPLAAFGGSHKVMRLEAENRVVHGGTYTGGPPALAAAKAALGRIAADPALYDVLETRSARLAAGIEAAFERAGVAGHVRRIGSMLQPFLSARPEREPRSVPEAEALQDAGRYTAFCDALERHGVITHRYPLGRWFVSTEHGEAEVESTLAAADAAAAELA